MVLSVIIGISIIPVVVASNRVWVLLVLISVEAQVSVVEQLLVPVVVAVVRLKVLVEVSVIAVG